MKFPDDVQKALRRRFASRHRQWLEASADPPAASAWPLEIALGVPTENQALKQLEDLRAWIAAWQSWRGAGTLCWGERRWRKLGAQPVPEKLRLADPGAVARWIGEAERWERASRRYRELLGRWPRLGRRLPRYFAVLADYSEADYRRLLDTLAWIDQHPACGLYPRQLPVSGLDSKWFERRKGLLADLIGAARGAAPGAGEVYARCGLKAPPPLIRLRLLDERLRQKVGGLGDLSAPWPQLAALDLPVRTVFIVENLQTGLAFHDLPGSLVIMQLGYGVDVLARLPWVASARCLYWGDLDTHGFAILNRARSHLPELQSVLMDEATLHGHRRLWGQEQEPHAAQTLPLLTDPERAVYRGIKSHTWGQNVRLEQERIAWDVAWKTVQQVV